MRIKGDNGWECILKSIKCYAGQSGNNGRFFGGLNGSNVTHTHYKINSVWRSDVALSQGQMLGAGHLGYT